MILCRETHKDVRILRTGAAHILQKEDLAGGVPCGQSAN